MGQVFLPSFLRSEPEKATVNDVVRSIDYVVQHFGASCIGLGSDFDGFSGRLKGLEDVSRLPEISARLLKLGYQEDVIGKILGDNFLRVWDAIAAKK